MATKKTTKPKEVKLSREEIRFNTAKTLYENGRWDIKMLRTAVLANFINAEQFETLAGIPFTI